MWEEHLCKLRELLEITVREVPGEAVRSTVLCTVLPCSGSRVSVLELGRSAVQNQLRVREEGELSFLSQAKLDVFRKHAIG